LLKSSVFVTDPKALKYVEEMRFRSALKKLFDRPFPTEPNFFKRGQKLEGIDPEHEALFCVMTVVDVCGNYEIKCVLYNFFLYLFSLFNKFVLLCIRISY